MEVTSHIDWDENPTQYNWIVLVKSNTAKTQINNGLCEACEVEELYLEPFIIQHFKWNDNYK